MINYSLFSSFGDYEAPYSEVIEMTCRNEILESSVGSTDISDWGNDDDPIDF